MQLAPVFSEQLAYKQRASLGVSPEIIRHDDGYAAAFLRASQRSLELLAEWTGRAPRSNQPIEPPIAPIYDAKAVNLAVVPRGLDESLSPTAFLAPDASECRVQRELDLILQIEVRLGQEPQKLLQVSRGFTQQIGLDQFLGRWRFGVCCSCEKNLHP
jgi:hypothetical protein